MELPLLFNSQQALESKWRYLCPSYIHHHFCLYDLQEDGGKCLSSIKSLDSFYLIKALNKNIETDICTHTKNIVNPVLWDLWNGSDLKKKKKPSICHFPLSAILIKSPSLFFYKHSLKMLSVGLSLPCTFVLLLILDKVLECSNIIELISA